MQHEYTPTIEEVLATLRSNYQVVMSEWQEDDTDRLVEYGAHFDSVIARIEAAAEQRGAARAFKESANEVRREMRWQYEQNINRNSDTGDSIDRLLELEKVFKYRADLLEGDDAQSST